MDSRNRLWWVIGGVGLLLVVVLTGGLFWLSPVDSAAPVDDLALPPRQQGTAAFEYVAGQAASGAEGQAAAGAGARATQAGFTGAAVAVASSDGAEPTAPVARAVPRITVDQAAPATVAAAPAVRAIPTSSARTTAAPAAARTPAAASPRPEPVAVRAVPAPALTPAASLQEFWVQVGSFASRKRADDLGQRLSDQGIVSRVTTRNSGAEVFFRVRVGPYASRAEAEKFLAWVKRVDGLDGSYIAAVRNAGG